MHFRAPKFMEKEEISEHKLHVEKIHEKRMKVKEKEGIHGHIDYHEHY